MAATYERPGGFRMFIYSICIIAALFTFVFLTRAMFKGNPPRQINEGGRPERVQALEKLRKEEAAALKNYGVIDANKGLYRLSIERAMEMVAQTKDPAKVRAELAKRAEKAAAPVPQPSYE